MCVYVHTCAWLCAWALAALSWTSRENLNSKVVFHAVFATLAQVAACISVRVSVGVVDCVKVSHAALLLHCRFSEITAKVTEAKNKCHPVKGSS